MNCLLPSMLFVSASVSFATSRRRKSLPQMGDMVLVMKEELRLK